MHFLVCLFVTPKPPAILTALLSDSTLFQLEVVPANERTQLRWNANPYDLVGGTGYNEFDPGAWLLPYWIARYHNLIVS